MVTAKRSKSSVKKTAPASKKKQTKIIAKPKPAAKPKSVTKTKKTVAKVKVKKPVKAPTKKVVARKPSPEKKITRTATKVLAPKPEKKLEKKKAPLSVKTTTKAGPLNMTTTVQKKPKARSEDEWRNISSTAGTTGSLGIAPYQPKASETYMNTAQKEHFKKILFAWKGQLVEEAQRTVDDMKDEAPSLADPNDRATQEEEFSLALRARDRERKLIRKIDEALLRLKSDDYGYCEVCGIEIGIRRLEARPTATLCIDCKTMDEIKEKQIGA